jgi:hypothetical protein
LFIQNQKDSALKSLPNRTIFNEVITSYFEGDLMDSRFILTVTVAFVLVIVLGCTQATNTYQPTQGRVVAVLTDAKPSIANISSVEITVDSVEIHSNTSGWITLSNTSATYDLMALKSSGEQVALSDTNISPGTYEQIRMIISNVVVTDSKGEHIATLPSGELKIVGLTVVAENETSVIKFDFLVNESLHQTGDGLYIMAPVIQFESKQNATVTVHGNNTVEVTHGSIVESEKVSMNVTGDIGPGNQISDDANLIVSDNGHVEMGNSG